MNEIELSYLDSDGFEIHYYKWEPDHETIKGIVQISHGMSEKAERYRRFARKLTSNGYIVFAHDQRGHGKTAGKIENLGYSGQDGFNGMIKNIYEMNQLIEKEYPNHPLFLFGHSMGSFIMQRYICMYPTENISGLILSGTNGKQTKLLLSLASIIARREIKKYGEKHRSNLINRLTFGRYNRGIKNKKTEFDWLSRDEKEVLDYINDPYCGAICSAGFYLDMFEALKIAHQESEINKINKKLPIFIYAGDQDPVANKGKGIVRLYNMYKSLQIEDVSYKLYPGGRHEMLNEWNKEEVTNDILTWLNQKVESKSGTNDSFDRLTI